MKLHSMVVATVLNAAGLVAAPTQGLAFDFKFKQREILHPSATLFLQPRYILVLHSNVKSPFPIQYHFLETALI